MLSAGPVAFPAAVTTEPTVAVTVFLWPVTVTLPLLELIVVFDGT